jgi:hypothetical protein
MEDIEEDPTNPDVALDVTIEFLAEQVSELQADVHKLQDEYHRLRYDYARAIRTIERIESVESEQSATRQGIVAPQGLDGVSDPEWDDTTDDAYLAALVSKNKRR